MRDNRITSGYAGLATCGRIWLCPVCNSKVMAQRALEVGLALAWTAQEGRQYRLIWGGLTVQHGPDMPLTRLIHMQRKAWRIVMQSKGWKARKHLRVGYIRASEITYGAAGWHPHFHPIVIVNGAKAETQEFADWLADAWRAAVRLAGGHAGMKGQRLEVIEPGEFGQALGRYVTKAVYTPSQKLALEVVWSQSKNGRGRAKATEPHWALLDGAGKGIADDVFRWWELEEATSGHRMITWSRNLRKMAGIGAEESDEQVAGKELGDKSDTVCYITAEGWSVVKDRPALKAAILDELEQRGWAGLCRLLEREGVEYVEAGEGDGVVQLVKRIDPVRDFASAHRGFAYIDPEILTSTLKLGENLPVVVDEVG